MEKAGVIDFKVGQLAEMRTFEDGFRSAWFRCKVQQIRVAEKVTEKDAMLLEYFDFDLEEPSWVEIYQTPPYGRKSKELLMVRPPYPAMYHKDNMPPVTSLSDTCVFINGPWKVGNLVDWFKDDCFWSAKIIKVFSDDKVQIELPMFPVGQRKKKEEGKHEAFSKDLRPSLDWSETKGWTFLEGRTPCDGQLIFPPKQGTDLEGEQAIAEGDTDGDSEKNGDVEVVNASSATCIPAEGDRDRDSKQNENVKLDCGLLVESSESVSSLRVEKRKAPELAAAVEKRELNIMHERTLEAAMLDLEGLVNKVKWMQRMLQPPATTISSWKFA